MRRRVITGVVVSAVVAIGAWVSAAPAAEVEHKSTAPALSQGATALLPVFSAAGPPNFQLTIEAEFDNGGNVKLSRKLVRNVSAGTVRMSFSERKLPLSASDRASCRIDGTIVSFFGGLQLSGASGAAECGGSSSAVEGRLIAVIGIKGELFPLQEGNELSFTTQAQSDMVDLFPSAVHRLSIAGKLSGVTLNATGAPDVIYLIRNEESRDGANTLIVTDVYWSAGLRWPIYTRIRTDDGKVTFVARELLAVAGVMPYVLPDGRAVAGFDGRTSGSHPLAEIDAMARALWRAAKSDTPNDIDGAARVVSKLIDPSATLSTGIDAAFAPIASFVKREAAIQ
jgi:hypothetical protein